MAVEAEAMIIAGGLGTRLRGAVPDGLPKTLVPVNGRPFIDYLVAMLRAEGIKRVTLALGYGAQHVMQHFAVNPPPNDIEIRFAVEPEPLGTGGAIRFAWPQIKTDPFLVLNGDSYADVDLNALLSFHHKHRARITVALAEVQDTSRYGRVACNAHGAVLEFREKTASSGPGMINAGIYAVSSAAVAELPGDRPLSWERDVLAASVGNGLYAWGTARHFLDIGTPQSLSQASPFFSMIAPRLRHDH